MAEVSSNLFQLVLACFLLASSFTAAQDSLHTARDGARVDSKLNPYESFVARSELIDDTPIEIISTSGEPTKGIEKCKIATKGIEKCKKAQVPVRNIRIKSLKLSEEEYVRHHVSDDGMALFVDSTSQTFDAAEDLLSCAHATISQSYNAFTFESGVCTAYLGWRSDKYSSCLGDATRVVYVAKTMLTPVPLPAITVEASATFDVTYVMDISVLDLGDASKGIKLAWDDQSVVLEEGQTTYRFSPALNVQCRDGNPATITITSVDSDSEDNSNPTTVTLSDSADDDDTWHLMNAGGCVHGGPLSGAPQGTQDQLVPYCEQYNSLPFYAEKEGDFEAYQAALKECTVEFDEFWLALTAVDNSNTRYQWYGGYEVDESAISWAGPPLTEPCVAMIYDNDPAKSSCDSEYYMSCYQPTPPPGE